MAKRINTRGRLNKFYDCEKWAINEALECHANFMRDLLEVGITPQDEFGLIDEEHREYCQHILAHCEDLLEEFRDGAEPAEEHPLTLPAHPVLQ